MIALGVLVLSAAPAVADTISSPVTEGHARESSLALAPDGNPIVAYHDADTDSLKVLRCDDPACTDGGETITRPDADRLVGVNPSLALDHEGHPVVAYRDYGSDDLKVLRCDDPACAGSGETITRPDAEGRVGANPSLALDDEGNPVVAYRNQDSGGLHVLRCDDPACSDGGETITRPDADGVALNPSMMLDAAGNPVVAYGDYETDDLHVLRCNDPACAGGDETLTSPGNRSAGVHVSLKLDAVSHPVVAYPDTYNQNLKVLRCDDPACADGGETITSPVPDGTARFGPSLALDREGHPIVSYRDQDSGGLHVLRCDDPACADSGETITTPDTDNNTGWGSWLALDNEGHPVVAYADDVSGILKVLHCDDPACAPTSSPVVTPGPDVSVDQGETVDVSASAVDPDEGTAADEGDGPVELVWDLDGDRLFDDAAGTTATFDAVGLDDGERTVRVRAVDDEGQTGTAALTVTVVNVGPTVDVGGPYIVDEGATVTLTGVATDPSDALTTAWDLDDDGVFGETGPAAARGDETGMTPTFTAPATDGDRDLVVWLRADDGTNLVRAATVVTVHEADPPAIVLPADAADGAVTATEDEAVGLSVQVVPADATVTWDLDGDGDCDDATGTEVTPTFPDQGPQPVIICADDGVNSATEVLTVVVRDVTTASTVLSGPDRIATAIATSGDTFADGSADAVVLARADVFADALAGTALAVRANGPLLLTPPDDLPSAVSGEIDRVLPDGGTVYLLGGQAALSGHLADQLAGHTVVRLDGATRYDTATAIAHEVIRLDGAPDTVLLARGDDFADGLAAGAIASAVDGVVLLTAGDNPDAATTDFLADHPDTPAVAVGGAAATAHPEATPIVGQDRYATATRLAQRFLDRPAQVGIARGDDFPDAMTGGVHIGRLGGALLLTRPASLPDATATHLCSNADTLDIAYTYGGPHAITPTLTHTVDITISTPPC